MVRFSIAAALSVAVLCCAGGRAVGEGKPEERVPTVLTEKDVDRVLKAKKGDLIEIRLPSQAPFVWVLEDAPTVLRAVDGASGSKDDATPPASPPAPRLGAVGSAARRYEITAGRAAKARPTWIYCRFGKPEMTRKRIEEGVIPPPPKFRPDLERSELREGMAYHINLEVQP